MIIITGASDGLGLELARLFHEQNKTVVNISRRESPYAQHNIKADLTDPKQISQATENVKQIKDPISALIHCAGMHSIEKLGHLSAENLQQVFMVNVESVALLISGLKERVEKDNSDIVLISSTLGHEGRKDRLSYGTSKWAVRGLGENLRQDLATNRVITISPGGFLTDIYAKASKTANTAKPSDWMDVKDVASFIKTALELPKNMEVSELVLRRKTNH